MDVDWLKSLAVRLRGVLAEHGVTISHGQALDLIAAVPGLRDWSEVVAFPMRVATCRSDEQAVERIARRVTSRHSVPIHAPMLPFSLRRMSLLYRPSSALQTKRLIVTSTDSGAGHLLKSRIADQIETTDRGDALVSGPVPLADGPVAFHRAREAAFDRDPSIVGDLWPWNRAEPAITYWSELLTLFALYERVELWIDSAPDAQLQLIRVLDWLSARPDLIEKLSVIHADGALGERGDDDIRTLHARIEPVGDEHLRVAEHAWDAYRRPTPQPFFALLADDLAVLPHLRRAMLLLLGELPAADTGLGATERLLLSVVEPGGVGPAQFASINAQRNPDRVFDAFGEYRIVNRMAVCAAPAIVGLRDTALSSASMMDAERRKRYHRSELSLSDLGRALLGGREDFARHNAIHRWWGGTLLVDAQLWRWDAERQRLVAPA